MPKEGNYKGVVIYLLFLVFISLFFHSFRKPLSLWIILQQIRGESDVLKGKYVTSAACSCYLVTSSWQWGEQAQKKGKQNN